MLNKQLDADEKKKNRFSMRISSLKKTMRIGVKNAQPLRKRPADDEDNEDDEDKKDGKKTSDNDDDHAEEGLEKERTAVGFHVHCSLIRMLEPYLSTHN